MQRSPHAEAKRFGEKPYTEDTSIAFSELLLSKAGDLSPSFTESEVAILTAESRRRSNERLRQRISEVAPILEAFSGLEKSGPSVRPAFSPTAPLTLAQVLSPGATVLKTWPLTSAFDYGSGFSETEAGARPRPGSGINKFLVSLASPQPSLGRVSAGAAVGKL